MLLLVRHRHRHRNVDIARPQASALPPLMKPSSLLPFPYPARTLYGALRVFSGRSIAIRPQQPLRSLQHGKHPHIHHTLHHHIRLASTSMLTSLSLLWPSLFRPRCRLSSRRWSIPLPSATTIRSRCPQPTQIFLRHYSIPQSTHDHRRYLSPTLQPKSNRITPLSHHLRPLLIIFHPFPGLPSHGQTNLTFETTLTHRPYHIHRRQQL